MDLLLFYYILYIISTAIAYASGTISYTVLKKGSREMQSINLQINEISLSFNHNAIP